MKKVIVNYIFSIMFQLLNILLPLITTPYIARTLGVANVGYNSYITSIVNYFTLFAMFGTNMYGQREIGSHQNDKEKYSQIFYKIIIIKIIIGLIVSVAYAIVSYVFFEDFLVLFLIRYFSLAAVIFDISWFFQGLENFKITVIRQMIVKILAVISIFIFVNKENDLWKYMLIDGGLTFLGTITIYSYLPKYLVKVTINIKTIRSDFKEMLSLFIPQIATSLYAIIDKSMIGMYYSDGIESGYYEQAYKIEMIGISIVVAFTNVLIPRLALFYETNKKRELYNTIKQAIDYIIFMGVPLAFGISAICKNVLPWFLGGGYDKSSVVLSITAFLILIMGLTNFWGFAYLVATKQSKIYTKSVFLGTGINIILNFILIKLYASIGAAIASVLSEIVVLIFQTIVVRKQIDLKEIFKGKIIYIIDGFIMWLIVSYLSRILSSKFINSILIAMIGALIYLVILVINKDKYLLSILDKLKIIKRRFKIK